jgi:hypothetical protein
MASKSLTSRPDQVQDDLRDKLLKSPKQRQSELASDAAMMAGTSPMASLTHRQSLMCEAIALGKTGLDAYRLAFDCPTSSDRTIQRKVAGLLAKPSIREEIEQHRARLRAAHERATLRTAKDVTRALWAEAESMENGGNVRVRALELLGRNLGMFSDNPQQSAISGASSKEIETQIKSLLDRFMGKDAIVINGLAKPKG